jgi:hypothetical protein
MRDLVSTLPCDNYVIGVGYKEGDFQIGITGKTKERETFFEASKREMKEETRLTGLSCDHRIRDNVYVCNINELKLMESEEDDDRIDDFERKRVYICIHGTYEDINKYLEEVQFVDHEDGIVYIWACRVACLYGIKENTTPEYLFMLN